MREQEAIKLREWEAKFDQKQKFVIAVGYLSDQVKQYLLHAHPKTKFEFVNIKKKILNFQ